MIVTLVMLAGNAIADDDWTKDLLARTDTIAKEVSELRGLKIKKKLARDVVDVDGLRARLVKRFEQELTPEQIAGQQLALERWGLVAPGQDVHDLLIDVLTEQISGFYDHADRTLYIADRRGDGGDGGDWPDMLMAHEIEHALQDQHFDLDKLTDLPASDGDAKLARQALIEGDGLATQIELVLAREGIPAPWGQADAVAMITRTMEANDPSSGEQLASAPLVVRDLLMFPYTRGLGFVASIRARHAWSAVDDAFEHPPASTEQILHPEAYLTGDAPRKVIAKRPAALSGWRTVHETTWGEAGWLVLLREHDVALEQAETAAAGWGGDRVVVYAPEGDPAPRHATGVGLTAWDADIDAMEFEESAVLAIDALVVGEVIESSRARHVWLGTDLRVSIVERRDDQVLVVVGAPATTVDAIADDVWKAWKVK